MEPTPGNQSGKMIDLDTVIGLMRSTYGDSVSRMPSVIKLLYDNFVDNKNTELNCEIGIDFFGAIADFMNVFRGSNKKGVILGVISSNNIDGCFKSMKSVYMGKINKYYGKKSEKKPLKDDFVLSDMVNVLITTPDIFKKEFEVISKIQWTFMFTDIVPREVSPYSFPSCHQIILYYPSIISRLSDYQRMIDLFSMEQVSALMPNEANNAISSTKGSIQGIINKRSKSNDPQMAKIQCKVINCPLCKDQRVAIQRAVHTLRKDILEKKFHMLSKYFLWIYSHPYLVPRQEYLYRKDFSSLSTKLAMLGYLLNESYRFDEKVIIISESSIMLDMIEDFLITKRMKSHRISMQSTEGLTIGHNIFLLDQNFFKFSVESPFFRFLCTTIHCAIVYDGDSSSVLSTLRLAQGFSKSIKKMYKLECCEFFESHLYKICNTSENQIGFESIETLCRSIALLSFQEVPELLPEFLINSDSSSTGLYYLEDELKESSFWDILINECEYDDNINLDLNEDDHLFTSRERDQFTRSLFRYGFGRWDDIIMNSGVHVSRSQAEIYAICIMNYLFKKSRSTNSYVLARSLIASERFLSETKSEEVFNDNDYKNEINNNVSMLLKRIEMIYLASNSLIDVNFDINQLPEWSPTGEEPSAEWTSNMDRLLAYGFHKYGYGCFEYFCLDPKPELLEILYNDGELIEQSVLLDRYNHIGDALRRQDKSDANKPKKVIKTKEKKERDPTVSKDWTRAEEFKVRKQLLKSGIELDSSGERDFASFRDVTGLEPRSVEDVKEFVEDYFHQCEIVAESSPIEGEDSEEKDEKDIYKIFPQTAAKIVQRVKALEGLRKLFVTTSEADFEEMCQIASKKRVLPLGWTPKHESTFFHRLSELGFGSNPEILKEPFFAPLFNGIEPPDNLLSDHKVVKRIHALLDLSSKDDSKKIKKKSEKKKSQPVEGEVKKSKSKGESLNKALTYKEFLKLDKIVFPIEIAHRVTLEEVGEVVYNRKGFHTSRYIFPAGFKLVKDFWSPVIKGERCRWRCEIIDEGGEHPVFKVSCIDHPEYQYQGSTPSAPWAAVAQQVSQISGNAMASISGTSAYLFSNPITNHLIKNLPNVEKCIGFGTEVINEEEKIKNKVKNKEEQPAPTKSSVRTRNRRTTYYEDFSNSSDE